MTQQSTDREPDGTTVFIWFGRPDLGRPYVLMVPTINREARGITYRPLMYLDRTQANDNGRQLAEMAGRDLGVTVELHEYAVVQVHDRIEADQ